MDISVIIVSYNVRYFLEQCLASLQKSLTGLNHEVFVVDNNSSDSSIEYLQPIFPSVRFIANNKNLGFAKANNQAISIATGRYILFLNPDTIIGESSIHNVISHLDSTPGAGAAGIRMIDGSGRFLRESKRGFPSPWAAFCRFSGLSELFPRSTSFARYYLGHLADDQDHEIEALSGAFLMVRKSVLDITGGFDERFFMYAEDIDLSYRIIKAGFKNIYVAGSPIIHFKGESTIKDQQYRDRFYRAMVLFNEKYNHGLGNSLKRQLLQWAIRLVALSGNRKFKEAQESTGLTGKISCKGDPLSIKEIESHFQIDPGSGNLVFCPGPSFSYENAITEMMESPGKYAYFLHGKGTRSLVGSGDKTRQGVALPFSD